MGLSNVNGRQDFVHSSPFFFISLFWQALGHQLFFWQWGTADVGINGPSADNPELIRVPSFMPGTGIGQNMVLLASCAAGNFRLPNA